MTGLHHVLESPPKSKAEEQKSKAEEQRSGAACNA
jgi:hypothetical protein